MSLRTNSRIVIDTNVLISGILWGGKPWNIIKSWREGKFLLVISPFILAELVGILERNNLKKIENEVVIEELRQKSIKLIPSQKTDICRDKKDNQILDLCLAGRADYLVTGDKDLLYLKKFKTTKIVTPKIFLSKI